MSSNPCGSNVNLMFLLHILPLLNRVQVFEMRTYSKISLLLLNHIQVFEMRTLSKISLPLLNHIQVFEMRTYSKISFIMKFSNKFSFQKLVYDLKVVIFSWPTQ